MGYHGFPPFSYQGKFFHSISFSTPYIDYCYFSCCIETYLNSNLISDTNNQVINSNISEKIHKLLIKGHTKKNTNYLLSDMNH